MLLDLGTIDLPTNWPASQTDSLWTSDVTPTAARCSVRGITGRLSGGRDLALRAISLPLFDPFSSVLPDISYDALKTNNSYYYQYVFSIDF